MNAVSITPNYRQERQQRATLIIAKLEAGLEAALSRYPVELAYLYGSVARGNPLPTSDVDLALVLAEPMPVSIERLNLELHIQATVEDVCGLQNVDVRAINTAPVLAQGEIVQEGRCLYVRDEARRALFESLTRRKYFDYRLVADKLQADLLQHIREKGLAYG